MCVDQLILFMNFWFGVILCIHYVSCVCHYGIPTICILSCFRMCSSHSVSLSYLLSITYIIESIHSFHGEGVIFIRYMCCSYSLYHEKCLFVMAKLVESEWDEVVLPICRLLVVYPDCPSHLFVLGILLQKFYISLWFWFIFVWRRGTRMCEKERAYFYRFFPFLVWLGVSHDCMLWMCTQSGCSLTLLSRGTVSVFYSFAHFFSLFYSFAFHVLDGWRVECRLSPWMSLLIFPFY